MFLILFIYSFIYLFIVDTALEIHNFTVDLSVYMYFLLMLWQESPGDLFFRANKWSTAHYKSYATPHELRHTTRATPHHMSYATSHELRQPHHDELSKLQSATTLTQTSQLHVVLHSLKNYPRYHERERPYLQKLQPGYLCGHFSEIMRGFFAS